MISDADINYTHTAGSYLYIEDICNLDRWQQLRIKKNEENVEVKGRERVRRINPNIGHIVKMNNKQIASNLINADDKYVYT